MIRTCYQRQFQKNKYCLQHSAQWKHVCNGVTNKIKSKSERERQPFTTQVIICSSSHIAGPSHFILTQLQKHFQLNNFFLSFQALYIYLYNFVVPNLTLQLTKYTEYYNMLMLELNFFTISNFNDLKWIVRVRESLT